jgi:hypothetical protein
MESQISNALLNELLCNNGEMRSRPFIEYFGKKLFNLFCWMVYLYYNLFLLFIPFAIISADHWSAYDKIEIFTWFYIFLLIFPSWGSCYVRTFTCNHIRLFVVYICVFFVIRHPDTTCDLIVLFEQE